MRLHRHGAPRRGRSRPSSAPWRSSCSTSSRRSRGRSPTTSRRSSPGSSRSPTFPRPRRRAPTSQTGSRVRGSAARPAACSESRSSRSRAKASARSPRQPATGPSAAGSRRRGFPTTCRSVGPGIAPAGPRASPRTSRASPRTTISTSRCSVSSCSSAPGRSSTRSTSRRRGSTTSRRGGSSPPSVSPSGTFSRRTSPPRLRAAGTRFASGSARASASTRTGGRYPEIPSRPRGWRGWTRGSAIPRTASTQRCSWPPRTRRRSSSARRPRARTQASRSSRRGAGSRRRSWTARELAGRLEWEGVVDELYARLGGYHWVHAIPNTALTAAALYAFDGDFAGGICAAVQGGWDTDTNGAAVGSILGATVGASGLEDRWTAPLEGRFASSLPGFGGIEIDELVARTLACRRDPRPRMTIAPELPRDPLVPRPLDLPTDVPADGPLDALDPAKIVAAPDDPAEWPAWRAALSRWRDEARRRIAYDGSAYERPELAWTQQLLLGRARLALGRPAVRPRRGTVHAGALLRPRRAGVRRLRRDRALARVPRDRDRRAKPVRLLPRRNRARHARDRPSTTRNPRLRRLQPVGRRHAARAGLGRRGDRGAGRRARSRRRLPRHDEGGTDPSCASRSTPPVPESRSRASRPCRSSGSATTISRGRSGSPTARVPGVIRARWFEQRHMLHHTRRWNRDHTEELQSAWLNGVGVLVWENVFGSWVGWNERDKAVLRAMRPVQQRYGRAPRDRRVDTARGTQRRGAPGSRRVLVVGRPDDALDGRQSRRPSRSRAGSSAPSSTSSWSCRRTASPPT